MSAEEATASNSGVAAGEGTEVCESNSDEEMVDSEAVSAPVRQSSNRLNNSLAASYKKVVTASGRTGGTASPIAPSTPPVSLANQLDPPPTPAG